VWLPQSPSSEPTGTPTPGPTVETGAPTYFPTPYPTDEPTAVRLERDVEGMTSLELIDDDHVLVLTDPHRVADRGAHGHPDLRADVRAHRRPHGAPDRGA
jgi:hypothetical protein